MIKLEKFIINPENKSKWKQFCLETCKNNQESILKNLVKDIVKHEVHVGFLNTIFCSEYTKNPKTALQILHDIFKAGKEDRENFSKAAEILRTMESQISEWSKPGRFSALRENLHQNLDHLQNLLKFDTSKKLKEALKDPINGSIIINYLNKLVDIFDLSIKQVQINNLYSHEQKTDQVRNFCDLINDFYDLMNKLEPHKYFKQDINAQREFFESIKKDKLVPSQLDISPTFSINRDVSMVYLLKSLMSSSNNNVSLADIHSLIHQIMLQYISKHNASMPVDKNLINASLPLVTKLQKHFTSKKTFLDFLKTDHLDPPELRLTNIEYPEIFIAKYNIPLDEHSGTLDLQFDWNTGEYNIKYTLYGHNVFNRWESTSRFGSLLINSAAKNSQITKKYYDPGGFAMKGSVILETKTKEFEDAKIILEICNSLSKATFSHNYPLIEGFHSGGIYNIFVGKEFDKLTKDKFDFSISPESKKQIKEWYILGLLPLEEVTNGRILKLANFVNSGMFPKANRLKEDTLKRLLNCKEEIFDFITSPQAINLFRHGINVNDVLNRAETEDINGFTEEEKTFLTSLNLSSDEKYNSGLGLIDNLIEIGKENQSEQLLSLVSKLIKRKLEEAILINYKEGIFEIIDRIHKISDKSYWDVFNYFKNLAMHGHEEILTECFGKNSSLYSENFNDAAKSGNSLVIRTLLNIDMQKPESTNVNDRSYPSPAIIISKALVSAAENDQAEIVKILLEAGADIDAAKNSVSKAKDKEIIKLLKKYTHNPVDYLLESHQDNVIAFLKAIGSLTRNGYDFTSHNSPDRTWDLDAEKVTNFLNQEVAAGKTTNFRKIIKSGNQDSFELALSFKPNIKEQELDLIRSFYPEFSIDKLGIAKQNVTSSGLKPTSWIDRIKGNNQEASRQK